MLVSGINRFSEISDVPFLFRAKTARDGTGVSLYSIIRHQAKNPLLPHKSKPNGCEGALTGDNA